MARSENARLAAEVERLRAQLAELEARIDAVRQSHREWLDLDDQFPTEEMLEALSRLYGEGRPAEVVRVTVRNDGRLFLPVSPLHGGGTLFGTTMEFTHAIGAKDGDVLYIVKGGGP